MSHFSEFPVRKYVLLLFCFSLISIPVQAGESEDHIIKGGKFIQSKDYKKAIVEYEAAVEANPKNAKANLLLGLTYASTDDLDKAIKYTEAALKIEPGYTGYYNLGLIYADRSDFDKSIQAYQNALKISPNAFQAWHQLGKVYANQGDFPKAIQAYGQATQMNPQFGDAYLGLGSAYYWSGDKASAMKQVEELKKLKMTEKAGQLEYWINDKEGKKKSAASPAEVPAAKS